MEASKLTSAAKDRDRGIQASPLPLYRQVKKHITDRIDSGQWPPDARVPSENELVAQLGISRMTINRALRELTAEGILIRLQGVGTFVAPQMVQTELMAVKSIADEIRGRGGVPGSEIHLLAGERADGRVAAALELPVGTRVYHSIMVHTDRGLPVQLAERYVNPALAPDFLDQDFTRMTPSDYLFQCVAITEVEHIVEAVTPDATTRRLLTIGTDEACLVLHRRTWFNGVVVNKGRFVYPGSRYRMGSRFRPDPGSDSGMV